MNARPSTGPLAFALAVVALGALGQALFLTTLAPGLLASYAFDDAGYFFQIARNLAEGRGATFDGVTPTNGYQPLWVYVLTPVFWLGAGPPERLFRYGLLLQVVLLWIAGYLLYSRLRGLFSSDVLALSALLFCFLVLQPSVNGMESALLALVLCAVLAYGWDAWASVAPGLGRGIGFGSLLGLTVLARLDTIFLAASALALGMGGPVARPTRSGHWRGRLGVIVGLSLSLVPYLSYNALVFGSAIPISGLLKSSFPVPAFHGDLLGRLGVRGVLQVGMALAWIGWSLARRRKWQEASPGSRYLHLALAAFALGVILHSVYSVLFMAWAAFRWHFLWYGLFTTLVLSFLLETFLGRIRGSRRRLAAGVVGALVVAAFGLDLYRRQSARPGYDWRMASAEAASWARTHTPRDAVFAMHDAGVFGFFGERAVVNLDGLVNDMGYQRVLRDELLGSYLRDRSVAYLVKHDFGDRDWGGSVALHGYERTHYRVYSRRYHVWSDSVELLERDEVFRSRDYVNDGKTVACVIWRLHHGGAGRDTLGPRAATRRIPDRGVLAAEPGSPVGQPVPGPSPRAPG